MLPALYTVFNVVLPKVNVCVGVKKNKWVNIILCTVTALCLCCCQSIIYKTDMGVRVHKELDIYFFFLNQKICIAVVQAGHKVKLKLSSDQSADPVLPIL